MNEFTGDYYKCNTCGHFWDYNDFHCPECGSEDFQDKPIGEEIVDIKTELIRVNHMKDLHQS